MFLAIVYHSSDLIPILTPLFKYLSYGVSPIILFSLSKFIKLSSKNSFLAGILVISCLLSFSFDSEIIVIFTMGIVGMISQKVIEIIKKPRLHSIDLVVLGIVFYKFLIIGFTLFGGGFLLIAYVKNQFIASGLLTEQQVLDAIAFGQFTPGPILTSATFMGYQIAGISGALLGTLGIFLPSLFLVPIIYKVFLSNKKTNMSLFLDSINSASIGVMTAVTLKIIISLGSSLLGWGLIAINSFLLWRRVPTYYLILCAMMYGLIMSFII